MVDFVSARQGLNPQLNPLGRELVELQKARENARHDKDETAGYGNHVGEAATETFEAERDLALIDNLEQMRGHVQEALQRIEEGAYGSCVTCGKPIPVERLAAPPPARQT